MSCLFLVARLRLLDRWAWGHVIEHRQRIGVCSVGTRTSTQRRYGHTVRTCGIAWRLLGRREGDGDTAEESRPLSRAPNLAQETGAHNGAALSARHRMTVIDVVEEHARITETRVPPPWNRCF